MPSSKTNSKNNLHYRITDLCLLTEPALTIIAYFIVKKGQRTCSDETANHLEKSVFFTQRAFGAYTRDDLVLERTENPIRTCRDGN